jgi:hypothetical protein
VSKKHVKKVEQKKQETEKKTEGDGKPIEEQGKAEMVDDHAKDVAVERTKGNTGDANKTEEKQQFTELQKPPTKTFQSKQSVEETAVDKQENIEEMKDITPTEQKEEIIGWKCYSS